MHVGGGRFDSGESGVRHLLQSLQDGCFFARSDACLLPRKATDNADKKRIPGHQMKKVTSFFLVED